MYPMDLLCFLHLNYPMAHISQPSWSPIRSPRSTAPEQLAIDDPAPVLRRTNPRIGHHVKNCSRRLILAKVYFERDPKMFSEVPVVWPLVGGNLEMGREKFLSGSHIAKD